MPRIKELLLFKFSEGATINIGLFSGVITSVLIVLGHTSTSSVILSAVIGGGLTIFVWREFFRTQKKTVEDKVSELIHEGTIEYFGEIDDSLRLRELLARVHRDGGHYTFKHGIAKSTADADMTVACLHSEVEELTRELEDLRVQNALLSTRLVQAAEVTQGLVELLEIE